MRRRAVHPISIAIMRQRAIPEAITTHLSQVGIKNPTSTKGSQKVLIFKIQMQCVLHPRLELAGHVRSVHET